MHGGIRYRALSTKIFVGGLSTDTTEREFKEYFSKFGSVKDAGMNDINQVEIHIPYQTLYYHPLNRDNIKI